MTDRPSWPPTAPTPTGGARRRCTRSTRAASPTATATASATSPGVTSRMGYLAEPGRRRRLAEPVLPLGAGRRRLRRRRLPRRRTRAGHAGRLRRDGRRRRTRAGIKVIVDIVPNHTSDLHPWFQEALAAEPGSPARDRYIFRDGIGPDGDAAAVGLDLPLRRAGLDPACRDGQWYCHLFAPEQPDLNWDNREVRDDFLHHPALLGRPRRRRLPGRRGPRAGQGPVRAAAQQADARTPSRAAGRHRPALRPRRGARDLRRVARRSSTSTTRRAPRWPRRSPRSERRALYARPTGLGQAFNFDLLKADFDAARVPRRDHRLPGRGAAGRLVVDLGAVQPRRRPAHLPLRAAGRAPTSTSG